MKIPKTFVPDDSEKKLEDMLKRDLINESKENLKKRALKESTKRYVMQVYSQQYEPGWTCCPEIDYFGIEAKDDNEIYKKAAAYTLLDNRRFKTFRIELETIHGLERDFSSNRHYKEMKKLKQKSIKELEDIVGEKKYLKKNDMYKYIACVEI